MKERTGQAENRKIGKQLLIFMAAMLLVDGIALGLAAWKYELWWNELLTAAVMMAVLGFLYVQQVKKEVPKRFFWLLGLHVLEFAVILVSYQAEGMMRPVLIAPLLIAVLAGKEAGIAAMLLYSVVSAVICMDPTEVVLLYLSAGLVGICLLEGKRKFSGYLLRGAGFLVIYAVLNLLFVMYAYMQIEMTDVLYSLLGGALQIVPVCCFLPFLVEGGIAMPGVSGLAAIVAMDFPAMEEFKEREPVVFKHSRLVARLSSQAAAEIGANSLLAEAGGLYHEIGAGISADSVQESLRICKKYRLPASVQDMVKEHDADKKTPSTKESAIVMLSDTIVTLMEDNRKKGVSGIDINETIRKAFKKREDSGALLLSGLSEKEVEALQEFYIRVLGRA